MVDKCSNCKNWDFDKSTGLGPFAKYIGLTMFNLCTLYCVLVNEDYCCLDGEDVRIKSMD